MKKLSKKSTEFIELFFKLKNMDSITIKRHDIDILYKHYKYSWYEFDKLDKEIERLNNIIKQTEEIILNHYIAGHKVQNASLDMILNKLKELRGEDK